MPVPNTFANATTTIPLSDLDNNFATPITIGNTAVQLGNTVSTLNNMTFANVTISSVSTPLTVAQGGTGATTLAAENVIIGNAAGSVKTVAPGTTGNVLTSNGTVWLSQAANVTIGNTTVALGNTVTTVGNLTLTNPTLGTPASGNLTNCTADGTSSVGYRNIPQSGSDKTTSYSLATTDVGKFVGVGTSGSITIPNSTFAAGDVISLFNNTTGNITVTCSITTAYIAGTNTDKDTMTLATRGVATILFISGTVCVVSGNVS